MRALDAWWSLDLNALAPGADRATVAAVGTDLLRRLDEPHRRYHTRHHLVEVLRALAELEDADVVDAREALLARLVGWFHDAVYDPGAAAGENEQASAELAVRYLSALGVEVEPVQRVHELVLATATHDLVADRLAAAFHDADLWILSAPAERYAAYTRQVREEYAAVPDEAFRAGRAGILRPFLDRESIYATDVARQRWEAAARANVAGELGRLSSG